MADYYVNSRTGNDSNDGLADTTPVRTMARLTALLAAEGQSWTTIDSTAYQAETDATWRKITP